MLGSVWVDAAAAAQLANIANGPMRRRVAVLNAGRPDFTPRSYVTRASGSLAADWVIPIAPGGGGEDYLGAIVAQVKEHLRDPEAFDANELQDIRRTVEHMTKAAPVVIALPPPGSEPLLDEADLSRLLEAFACCTVLILSGHTPPPDGILPGVRRLRPLLGKRDEDDAFGWYRAIKQLAAGVRCEVDVRYRKLFDVQPAGGPARP